MNSYGFMALGGSEASIYLCGARQMTPSANALVGMIEQAYAAALDPAHWQEFTSSVGTHFRDGSTILWHANQIAASHRYETKVLRALE